MALIPDSELREARDVLSIFTGARPGGAVMDGRGQIWHFDGVGGWYFEDRRVEPLTLAKALNPDLAEAMDVIADNPSVPLTSTQLVSLARYGVTGDHLKGEHDEPNEA